MLDSPPAPLTPEELAALKTELNGWDVDEDTLKKKSSLVKTYFFKDFATALSFMYDCLSGIEKFDHHPEWTNLFNQVKVRLDTWDIGGRVSFKDVELARFLDEMAGKHGVREEA